MRSLTEEKLQEYERKAVHNLPNESRQYKRAREYLKKAAHMQAMAERCIERAMHHRRVYYKMVPPGTKFNP